MINFKVLSMVELLNADLKYQSMYRKINSRLRGRLKALEIGGDNNMNNPWKDISLSDYENHMASGSYTDTKNKKCRKYYDG